MSYSDRAKINVSDHIEKKGRFSYLSWVYALDELQKQDESATWECCEHIIYPDSSMMVKTSVTAFKKTLMMLLPVMDHKNNAIKNPDAFAINKAYMRCLAKNIAAHGIGLYIFAGEDIPSEPGVSSGVISDGQLADLEAVILDVNADVPKLIAYLNGALKININALEDLPSANYNFACQAVEAKRGK